MIITFLRIAKAELDDAFAWYEEQAIGLGDDFLDEIDQTLRLIASFPHLHPPITSKIRRCLLNRFPYAIYYGLSEGGIVVLAVAHMKRRPGYRIDRLTGG